MRARHSLRTRNPAVIKWILYCVRAYSLVTWYYLIPTITLRSKRDYPKQAYHFAGLKTEVKLFVQGMQLINDRITYTIIKHNCLVTKILCYAFRNLEIYKNKAIYTTMFITTLFIVVKFEKSKHPTIEHWLNKSGIIHKIECYTTTIS